MQYGAPEESAGPDEPVEEPEEEKEVFKIGMVMDITGDHSMLGNANRHGFELYLKDHNYTMAGHPVEFFLEDAREPEDCVLRARRLVEQENVDIIVGPFLAHAGYAMAEYTTANDITLVISVATADNITQRDANIAVVRSSWTSSQPAHPMADYAYNELGIRKVTLIGMDYAFGYEVLGGFQYVFEELGGEIVAKIWTPLATADFAPYLAMIPDDTEAIWACETGGDGMRFITAFHEYGLHDKYQLLMIGPATDESMLPNFGLEAAEIGIITAQQYSGQIDSDLNRQFVQNFMDEYDYEGGCFAEQGYVAAAAIEGVLEMLGIEEFRDPARFAEAWNQVQVQTPRGPLTFDEFNQPIQNIYIRKVEEKNGTYVNTIIHTYEKVSQFWTYDPDEYMARPSYSRDYPPFGN